VIAKELIDVGLGQPLAYNHVRLAPALGPNLLAALQQRASGEPAESGEPAGVGPPGAHFGK
jgi:hypothetical protein